MPDLESKAGKGQLKGLGLFILGKKRTLWDGHKALQRSEGFGGAVVVAAKEQVQFAHKGEFRVSYREKTLPSCFGLADIWLQICLKKWELVPVSQEICDLGFKMQLKAAF